MNTEDTDTPWSREAELGVLGAIMVDDDALIDAVEALEPDDFYHQGLRTIYRAMCRLYEANEPVDAVTLADHLRARGELEDAGGMTRIGGLIDAMPSASNVAHHAEIIRQHAKRRGMLEAAREMADDARNEPDINEALDRSEQRIFDIAHDRDVADYRAVGDAVWETFDMIEERADSEGDIVGMETGFSDLDEMLLGLQDGNFYVIAGRPSMGKSAFVANILEHVAVDRGHPAALFSLEDADTSVVLRMLCSMGGLDGQRVMRGDLEGSDYSRLSDAAGRLRDSPLWIDDGAAPTPLQIRAKARRLHMKHDVRLIAVDYLQLMQAGGESRRVEVTNISRSLKALAKELGVPVIAVSQLSRAPMGRDDKRPKLSDLRDTGAIEQDADVVMFVFREEVYLDPDEIIQQGAENRAEIIVGKQRNGPTGTVDMYFRKESTRFEETTPRSGPERAA